MMRPADLFRYCPRCAAPATEKPGQIPFQCRACGLTLFFNPTLAAAAFIFNRQGRLLWIRRAKEPAKGKLAIPGGFVDFGESAEEAVARETREEVGLELSQIHFLGSWPNQYTYREITYSVCDLLFLRHLPRHRKPLPPWMPSLNSSGVNSTKSIPRNWPFLRFATAGSDFVKIPRLFSRIYLFYDTLRDVLVMLGHNHGKGDTR